ncbi:MAG: 30S ribosomal protein S4 [Epulopiscium sp.]|nr:30S ribosomal protein S4 [Candidatus Epulonipiscium sp.]
MARPMGPRFKVARRLGVDVYGHPKALKRGVEDHRNISEYGLQLLEKQKLKAYYGVLEKQFRRYVDRAFRSKGNPGDFLVQQLECRLDNIVYRLGFGSTLREARQMVVHGHILVNEKRVDRPSYAVQVGDEIQLKSSSLEKTVFRDRFLSKDLYLPYLSKDKNTLMGTLLRMPVREEVPIEVVDSRVVEFYSKH